MASLLFFSKAKDLLIYDAVYIKMIKITAYVHTNVYTKVTVCTERLFG